MSVCLLGIHAVPPPDSMLSDCQTSLKSENHQHMLHLTLDVYMIASMEYIPAYITYLVKLYKKVKSHAYGIKWILLTL